MELYSEKSTKLFELISKKDSSKNYIIMKKRILIGSSEVCDFTIKGISPIHAIIEISGSHFKLYDMNSSEGCFINGNKVITEEFNLESVVTFGKQEFYFRDYKKEDIVPPPLEMLNPEKLIQPLKSNLPGQLTIGPDTKLEDITNPKVPRVEYPLGADINADFNEYIFEDTEHLYPIFKYDIEKFSVEIIILFNQKIFSVDYVPSRNGVYSLAGSSKRKDEIEFAYLGKKDKVDFVEIKNNEIFIHPIMGYQPKHVGENLKENAVNLLGESDVFRFVNGDIQIFVKKTEATPKVASAPVFRRDPEFKKYLILCLFFATVFTGVATYFKVDKELEKEKAPERLATILYKKKIPKIIRKKLKIDKKVKKIVKKVKKIAKKKAVVKKLVKKVVAKKVVAKKGKSAPNKKFKVSKRLAKTKKVNKLKKVSFSNKGQRRANIKKSKGRVDTFKAVNFKSTLSRMMAKGGNASKFKINKTGVGSTSNYDMSENVSGKSVKLAKVSKNIGSVKGSARGKLDSRQGIKGIVQKRSIYTEGVPYKTVVLGGLDPDVILQILIEHIPQFRYCYQRQLDISKKAFSGVVKLNFLIGASGYVTRANVTSISGLPGSVKGCVVNVLKGIGFPEPKGGGVVEVTQPMNFLAKVGR